MAKKRTTAEVPLWISQMGMLTDGTQADPQTGEVFPIGLEIADTKPIAIPAGMRTPPSLREQMDELFRVGRLREEANRDESVDEANDFDIDDYVEDAITPWQTEYDPLLGREISPAEFHEKFKSGELLEEMKTRAALLDREEDVNELIQKLDAAYSAHRKPKADVPNPDAPPAPTPAKQSET